MRGLAIDLSPLRESPAFRLVYAARVATLLVAGIVIVATSVQVFDLTGSSLAVAFLGLSLALPMGGFLLVGGVMADRFDRRLLMLWSRSLYVAAVVILLANAIMPEPRLWPIFLATFIAGATGGVSVPALMAVTPALVGRDRLAAAGALTALAMQVGGIFGPAVAGVLIAGPGLAFCYAIVLAFTVLTPVFLYFLPSLPPRGGPPQRALHSMVEGVGHVMRTPLLAGLLLIDFVAMVLATPLALLPQWGTEILNGGPELVGLLYAAPPAGALLAALTSGWTGRVVRSGTALIVAVAAWGAAVVALGLSSGLYPALAALALIGFADTISKILRGALLQRHTPDHLLGRVSSLWMMQAMISPALGNVQVGFMARLLTPPLALVLGGAACVLAAGGIAAANPALRRARLRPPAPEASRS